MSKRITEKKLRRTVKIRGTYHLSSNGIETDEIRAKILRRRLQILVHSCIYYEYDDNLISDSKWSLWSKELIELQKAYPRISERVDYHREFEDFDGSTGFNLPTRNLEVMSKARYLLKLHKEDKHGYAGHQAHRAKPGSDVIRTKIP